MQEGTVVRIYGEWAGTQVMLQATDNPAFNFIIFYINLAGHLAVGDT